MQLVSIIIPTYNHARFISQAVKSCLAQTYAKIEIIIIDDGSTDNIQQVLEPFQSQIRYFYQTNSGPSAARNKGIREAKGDYILFLDADDWIPPDKVELQAALLDKNPEIGLVYSAWNYSNANGDELSGETRPDVNSQFLEKLLLRQFFFPIGAALVRKKCIEEVGAFDEDSIGYHAEDTDLWIKIAAVGYDFLYLDEPLYTYRMVTGSMSKKLGNHFKGEIARLDKFFGQKILDKQILALKPRAYGIINFEYCAKFFQAGDIETGKNLFREAAQLCPDLIKDTNWVLEWIAGYCFDPVVKDPEGFINILFTHLPEEGAALKKLYHRSIGRYHIAAIFKNYKNQNLHAIKKHIFPAIKHEPRILLNKGFIKISLETIFKHKLFKRKQ